MELVEGEQLRLWSEKPHADRGSFRGYDVAPDGKRILLLVDAEATKPQPDLRLLLHLDDELQRRTTKGIKQ